MMRPLRGLSLLAGLGWASSTGAAEPNPTAKSSCAQSAEQAQRSRSSGKLKEARKGFVQCAQIVCPAQIRADCLSWLSQVEEETPSVLFRVFGANGDEVVRGEAEVDGNAVTPFDGMPIALDPGAHRVVMRVDGKEQAQTFVVVQGEKRKAVTVRLAPLPSASPPLTVPPAKSPPLWPGLLLTMGGVGTAAAGAVSWGLGQVGHDDLADGCAKQNRCAEADVRRAKTQLVIGDVLVPVGLILAAVGIYFVARSLSSSGTTSHAAHTSHAARWGTF